MEINMPAELAKLRALFGNWGVLTWPHICCTPLVCPQVRVDETTCSIRQSWEAVLRNIFPHCSLRRRHPILLGRPRSLFGIASWSYLSRQLWVKPMVPSQLRLQVSSPICLLGRSVVNAERHLATGWGLKRGTNMNLSQRLAGGSTRTPPADHCFQLRCQTQCRKAM